MFILNFCKISRKISRLNAGALPHIVPSRNAGQYKKSLCLKVTVLGAAGNVGKPLCLMLKRCPIIDELALHDLEDPCPFATELAHIDTRCKVSSSVGDDQLRSALIGSKIVVVVVAARATSRISYNAMFNANAPIVQELITNFATSCPHALLVIATNPVNSLVPLAYRILQKNRANNPKAIFGVTTINSVRANTFAAEILGIEPECVFVPVLGGNSDKTIVPLFSHTKPCSDFDNEELEKLTNNVQNAHYDILKVKSNHAGYLACAFAISRFVISLLKGMKNQGKNIETAYVHSSVIPNINYFAAPVLLGPGGIQKYLGLPPMSEYENCLLDNAISILKDDIEKGEHFFLVQGEKSRQKPICKRKKMKDHH